MYILSSTRTEGAIIYADFEYEHRELSDVHPGVFAVGGALAGLAYYHFVGCASGACPLASHPLVTMAYMDLVGWLLFDMFGKERGGKCNM